MILFMAFNLDQEDYSGLPTYCDNFLKEFKDEEIITINIIPDQENNYGFFDNPNRQKTIDAYLPQFQERFYPELEQLIHKIISQEDISHVICPDYLVESYTWKINFESTSLRKNNERIKKVLFVHLLYRGFCDITTKLPYYDQLKISAPYLMEKSNIEWKAVKTSSTIICNSDFTKRQLEHFYWDEDLSSKEILATPLGTNIDLPDLTNIDSGKWAYFGRLTAQKGIFYIMKDISINKEKYVNNPIYIAGEGDLDPMAMRAWYYDKTIIYQGLLKKDELQSMLKDMTFCIFPSIYEPYGLALNEAMRMGKICIVSHRDSGMLEQVVDGETGFIFNFEENSIIDYIETLKASTNLEEIAKNARLSAIDQSNHFSILRKLLFNKEN